MMETKLNEVRHLIGNRHTIEDSEIRETLWYYYFDIQETISWLLGASTVVFSIYFLR